MAVDEELTTSMKEMIGGCCVCSDERGWAENPLVYCDGHGCNVAVHQGNHEVTGIVMEEWAGNRWWIEQGVGVAVLGGGRDWTW